MPMLGKEYIFEKKLTIFTAVICLNFGSPPLPLYTHVGTYKNIVLTILN